MSGGGVSGLGGGGEGGGGDGGGGAGGGNGGGDGLAGGGEGGAWSHHASLGQLFSLSGIRWSGMYATQKGLVSESSCGMILPQGWTRERCPIFWGLQEATEILGYARASSC